MNRDSAMVLVIALIALGAVLAVALGAGGLTSTVEVGDMQPLGTPPPDGVVYSVRDEPKTRILGFSFGRKHVIGVAFLTDEACAERLQSRADDAWPVDAPECASDVDVTGRIDLTGRTADGHTIVGVVFEVTRACVDAVATEHAWPAVMDACASRE